MRKKSKRVFDKIKGRVVLWLSQPCPPFAPHPVVIEHDSWIYDRRGDGWYGPPAKAYKNGNRVSIDLPPDCLGREYYRYLDPLSGTVTLVVNRPENEIPDILEIPDDDAED